jgi:SAM-dependent methyltransferase
MPPSKPAAKVTNREILGHWWRESARARGPLLTAGRFLRTAWEFLRDSTPERKRRRYGDVDYDWEHRVDTSSATVGWRDRWRGLFLSPYQATDATLFVDMLSTLAIRFEDYVFIDLGSGKGRTLLMASEFPFLRIIGVEILPDLHRAAEENVKKYRSVTQLCPNIQTICGDAADFAFPPQPTVLYLFNPLPEAELGRVIASLDRSFTQKERPVYILYHNPLLEHQLGASRHLRRVSHNHQFSLWTNQEPPVARI